VNLFDFQAQLIDEATDVIAGSLAGVKMGLYKVELTVDKTLTLAALVAAKATYATYVKQTILWRAVSVNDAGEVEVQSEPLFWTPTDSVTPNSMWGLWIEDAGAVKLYWAGQFDSPPVPFNSTLDQLTVVVIYRPATQTIAVVIS